jgi:hypothetical protein
VLQRRCEVEEVFFAPVAGQVPRDLFNRLATPRIAVLRDLAYGDRE